MSELEVESRGLYTFEAAPDSPLIPPGPARVAIDCDRLVAKGSRLAFRVLITCGLPDDYHRSFEELEPALVMVVRDEAAGKVAAFRLTDEARNRLEPLPPENFVDQRRATPSPIFVTQRVNVPIEVEPSDPAAGVLVHVALQAVISNILRVRAPA